ncbi:SRPBCC family protein [Laceyella putida]|uniref:SRPBCC family protein n=1 Tax=Laceyella putida TaxID=110101 RepID=A0ABW2RH89_9BACL
MVDNERKGCCPMPGKTHHSIEIHAPIDYVFDLMNDIEKWPSLFTQFEKVEVLSKGDDRIEFVLQTSPDEEGNGHAWTILCHIDEDHYQVFFSKKDPYPLSYIKIKSTYDPMNDYLTVMTWKKEFDVDPKSNVNVEQVEEYINKMSEIQIVIVKEQIERMYRQSVNCEGMDQDNSDFFNSYI